MPKKPKRTKRSGFGSGKKNKARVKAGNPAFSLAKWIAPDTPSASALVRDRRGRSSPSSSLFANGLRTVLEGFEEIKLGGTRHSEVLALWPKLLDYQKRAILRLDEDLIRQILKRDMVETIVSDSDISSDRVLAEVEKRCMEESVDPRMVNAVQVCILRSLELTNEAREWAVVLTAMVEEQFAGAPVAKAEQLGLREGESFPTARLQERRARELGAGVVKPPRNKDKRTAFNFGEHTVARAVEERLVFELTRRNIHEQCALVLVYFAWISAWRWLGVLLLALFCGGTDPAIEWVQTAHKDCVDYFLVRIRKGRIAREPRDAEGEVGAARGGGDGAGSGSRSRAADGYSDDDVRVSDVEDDDDDEGANVGRAAAAAPEEEEEHWEECYGYSAGSNHAELRWKSESFLAGVLLLLPLTAMKEKKVTWFVFLAISAVLPWGLSLCERSTASVVDRSGLKSVRRFFGLGNKLVLFYFAWHSYVELALIASVFFKDLALAIIMLTLGIVSDTLRRLFHGLVACAVTPCAPRVVAAATETWDDVAKGRQSALTFALLCAPPLVVAVALALASQLPWGWNALARFVTVFLAAAFALQWYTLIPYQPYRCVHSCLFVSSFCWFRSGLFIRKQCGIKGYKGNNCFQMETNYLTSHRSLSPPVGAFSNSLITPAAFSSQHKLHCSRAIRAAIATVWELPVSVPSAVRGCLMRVVPSCACLCAPLRALRASCAAMSQRTAAPPSTSPRQRYAFTPQDFAKSTVDDID